MIIVTIPNWHPATTNQLLQGHWSKGAKLKKNDAAIIAGYFTISPKAKQKRLLKLSIGLGYKQRGCDPDAYFKSLLDALVKAGMLVDDSPKWVELAPVEYYRTDALPETRITLEDI